MRFYSIMSFAFKRFRATLNGDFITARQVAENVPWTDAAVRWHDLNTIQKRMALTETIAHLEFLADRGEALKNQQGGLIRYKLVD